MKFKNNKERYKKPKESLANSFLAAIEGLRYSFLVESNMHIHFFAFALVLLASAMFNVSIIEYLIIVLVSAMVIALELLNTAVEVIIDMVEPEFNPLAKIAKDASAAAVLVSAGAALIIGLVIFVPKVLEVMV